MDQIVRNLGILVQRQSSPATPSSVAAQASPTSTDSAQQLLNLLANPFQTNVQSTSIWAAIGTSIGFTAFIAFCFSFLRPYHQAVYAPKLKHADEKHAPPPIGKEFWAWFPPVLKTGEAELIGYVGMDACVFLRFATMCRNIFLALTVIGLCILLPVNLTGGVSSLALGQDWLKQITPLFVFGQPLWAQVVVAWLFDAVIIGFLWWNYRKVLLLRRTYFQSEEYQLSLHARTLMLTDMPKELASDEGLARIIDEVVPHSSFSRTSIARNVKDLPNLISQHDKLVRQLEKVLAIYLKNPDQLPPGRPMCRPSNKDPSYSTYPKGQKVDAIEYLTQRIRVLEIEIKEVRLGVDKRSSMLYGFASYSDIAEAHNIAYASRKKHPRGATIRLAPRPNDIIWDNVGLSPSVRKWKGWMVNLWVVLLTLVWIAPNALITIFLVNLENLGRLWPAFQTSLSNSATFWGVVQGILSPAITSLFYLVLPIIFRRLSIQAGDRTKTGRERHVLAKLYSFFVFNNLIVFSIFSSVWLFVVGIVYDTSHGSDFWTAVVKENISATLFISLCNVSPFWVTWLLQRQLGAAIDLAQLWPLVYGFFVKKFSNPTPRELIELTAPPAFDYASYYNYFLFYATVTLCYAGIQPLVLPAAALYFVVDVWLKKYLILYIFVTKTESGGMFWRVLFNRFIFGALLANLVVFLTVWSQGTHIQAFTVAPLPFILIAFKVWCARTFDDRMTYYSTRGALANPEAGKQDSLLRGDRLASRFGHPALYKPLITPMVHQRAQNILHTVYKGRLSDGREAGSGETMSVSGYSDAFVLDAMRTGGRPGKPASPGVPGFEFVPESQLDFGFFKNRSEFASEHGGGGAMYGRPSDLIRPGTPGSAIGDAEPVSRPGTPQLGGMMGGRRTPSGKSEAAGGGPAFAAPVPYRPGHMSPPPAAAFAPQLQLQQQAGEPLPRGRSPLYAMNSGSESALVRNAALPGAAAEAEGLPDREPAGMSHGALGGGPRGYSGLAQNDADVPADPTQYDYFRGSARSRTPKPGEPGQGWR